MQSMDVDVPKGGTSRRFTHMLLEKLDTETGRLRQAVFLGIFMTVAFSAATFGLTLSAVEYGKESHVEGRKAVTLDGEVMESTLVKSEALGHDKICYMNDLQKMAWMRSLQDIAINEDESLHKIKFMKVAGFEVEANKEGLRKYTVILADGTTVDPIAHCFKPVSEKRRALLANTQGTGGGVGYTKNSGSGSGSGGGFFDGFTDFAIMVGTEYLPVAPVTGFIIGLINPPGGLGDFPYEWVFCADDQRCGCDGPPATCSGPGIDDFTCCSNNMQPPSCDGGCSSNMPDFPR